MMSKQLILTNMLMVVLCIAFPKHSLSQQSVKDLDFLIGKWETEEQNLASGWWEKSARTGTYILDSTYIQLESIATNSSNKKRIYRFLIHYDTTNKQFEMICIYSNWSKVRAEILDWDKSNHKLILKSKPAADEYSEREGVIQFNSDFTMYSWTGKNKGGDPQKPSIFEYEEKGKKIELTCYGR